MEHNNNELSAYMTLSMFRHERIKTVKTEKNKNKNTTDVINGDGILLNAFQNLQLVWFIQSGYSSTSFTSRNFFSCKWQANFFQ